MPDEYRVVCYIRVEPEDSEPLTYEEAREEIEQARLMQPENLYAMEKLNNSLVKCPNCLEDGFDPVARGCDLCEFDETNDPNTW